MEHVYVIKDNFWGPNGVHYREDPLYFISLKTYGELPQILLELRETLRLEMFRYHGNWNTNPAKRYGIYYQPNSDIIGYIHER